MGVSRYCTWKSIKKTLAVHDSASHNDIMKMLIKELKRRVSLRTLQLMLLKSDKKNGMATIWKFLDLFFFMFRNIS